MDALQYKQVYLIGNIVILLYNGMAAFQYSEAVFGHIHYDVLDSLWVFDMVWCNRSLMLYD